MRIGRNYSLAVYDYNSNVIPRVNSVTDLRIVLSKMFIEYNISVLVNQNPSTDLS